MNLCPMQLWGECMSGNVRIRKSTLLLCRTGLLAAVALTLSVLENMIPNFPFVLPGMKLGLSNIAVMFSLELCSLPMTLAVVVVKALFALVTRGATAFFMSFAGGLLSALGMYLLMHCKKPVFGSLGVGVVGAFAHNMGQLLVAYLLVADGVYGYLPVLSAASLVTGALTGLVYHIVMPCLVRVPLFGVGALE